MTRNKNRSRPTYTRAGTPRRIRGDARLERLDATQRDRLRHWLERENLTYAAVVVRVRDEFGLSVGKSALGVYYQRHILAEHDDLAVTAAAFLAALPKDEPSPLALHRAQALAFSALCQPQPDIATAERLLDVVHRAKKRALARQRLALAHQRAALRAKYALTPRQPATPELRSPNSDLHLAPCDPSTPDLRTPISDLRTAPLDFRAIPSHPAPSPNPPPRTSIFELRSPNGPSTPDLRTPISDLRTFPLYFRAIPASSSLTCHRLSAPSSLFKTRPDHPVPDLCPFAPSAPFCGHSPPPAQPAAPELRSPNSDLRTAPLAFRAIPTSSRPPPLPHSAPSPPRPRVHPLHRSASSASICGQTHLPALPDLPVPDLCFFAPSAPFCGHSPPPLLSARPHPHKIPRLPLELPAPCAVRPLRPPALAVHLLALP